MLVELGFDPTWLPPLTSEGYAAEGAVHWKLSNEVFTITLSAPKSRNALSKEVLKALKELLTTQKAHVVLLQAVGSVFSSGHRFGDFAEELGQEEHRETLRLCSEVRAS